jgi:hypothetical protein
MATPKEEVIAKLSQIDEQVRALLGEAPERLAADRLRLIAGLAGYLRTHVQLHWQSPAANENPQSSDSPSAVSR